MSHRDSDPTEMDVAPFERGHVVWVEKTTSVESRPFVVLSNGAQSGHESEYVGVPLSTTEQESSVRISPDDWETGGPDEPAFAIAWRLQSFPHKAITRGIGALDKDTVDEIAEVARAYLEPSE